MAKVTKGSLAWSIVVSLVSAALGIAINLATDVKTNLFAWIVVGALAVLLGVMTALFTKSAKRKQSAQSGLLIDQSVHSSAVSYGGFGNTTVRADHIGNRYTFNTFPIRAVLILALAVVASAGLEIYVSGSLFSRAKDGADAQPIATAASLTLTTHPTFYYPARGALPAAPPPRYPDEDQGAHCQDWAQWAQGIQAAPTSKTLTLNAIAGTTSPITILSVQVRVFTKTSITGNQRIQCQYGAGGFGGTTIYPDLDHPNRSIPMDTTGDGTPNATIPPVTSWSIPRRQSH